ncbi:MAG: restriction endonuclease subunit S [Deltaproteobacteria bacterium]|nr:restriction endonuclease subunit S [Deltaproteobacteria bacterium]
MRSVSSGQLAEGRGEMPKGWVETIIEEVGIISTGNTPSKNDPDNYGNDIPFVKPGDLEKSGIISTTNEMLSNKGAKSARLIKTNAVMITCIGNLGRVGIAGKDLATNQQINSIQFYENCVLPKFGYFQSLGLKEWLEANSSATTLPIINKGRFSKAPFILPPLNEQKRIVAKLDGIMPCIEAVKERLDKVPGILKRFRQSVLTTAVTGKLTEQWREEHPEVGDWDETSIDNLADYITRQMN